MQFGTAVLHTSFEAGLSVIRSGIN